MEEANRTNASFIYSSLPPNYKAMFSTQSELCAVLKNYLYKMIYIDLSLLMDFLKTSDRFINDKLTNA